MSDISRRKLILGCAMGAAAIPAIGAMLSSGLTGVAQAAVEKKLLSESDPTAKALKYVEDASKSTTRKTKADKCASCQFFANAEKLNGKDVGTCTMFRDKYVAVGGWCSVYALKK